VGDMGQEGRSGLTGQNFAWLLVGNILLIAKLAL
jgi:hypothetical protein